MTTQPPVSEEELREQIAYIVSDTRKEAIWSDNNKHTRNPIYHDIGMIAENAIDDILTLITAQKEAWLIEELEKLKAKVEPYYTESDGVFNYIEDVDIEDRINELKKKGE